MSAINEKYVALGEGGSFLGQSTTPEQDCPDRIGRYNHFQGGSIYWSPQTGAYEVHGVIRGTYTALRGSAAFSGIL